MIAAIIATQMLGCGLLAPTADGPGQDAITSDHSIIQPDGYPNRFDDNGPHFDSDGFMSGFSGTLNGR